MYFFRLRRQKIILMLPLRGRRSGQSWWMHRWDWREKSFWYHLGTKVFLWHPLWPPIYRIIFVISETIVPWCSTSLVWGPAVPLASFWFTPRFTLCCCDERLFTSSDGDPGFWRNGASLFFCTLSSGDLLPVVYACNLLGTRVAEDDSVSQLVASQISGHWCLPVT